MKYTDTSGKRGHVLLHLIVLLGWCLLDVQLGHIFATQGHVLKPQTLQSMERAKRAKYTDLYRARGFAFAPLVTNSWGVLGPDVPRFLWAVADHLCSSKCSLLSP